MSNNKEITALRMERQFLTKKANEEEYLELYRDTQPGQNVYWHGFGDPPSITYRADFDDIEYNRKRQTERKLLKGRFQGGNLGWVTYEDLELFIALAVKPLDKPTLIQLKILEIMEKESPINIGLIKEMTGLLVKEITPALHRLQEAFLIYEDQYNGEWDRAWYMFREMFPELNINRYTKSDALRIVIQRFAYRNVLINQDMVKSFYKLSNKDIKEAITSLCNDNILIKYGDYYMLKSDSEIDFQYNDCKSIYLMHRNDFMVKSNEYWLKEKFKHNNGDILQYLLIDGEFKGAVIGKFKYGPYIIEDIVLDVSETEKLSLKNEIVQIVTDINQSVVQRYCGEIL